MRFRLQKYLESQLKIDSVQKDEWFVPNSISQTFDGTTTATATALKLTLPKNSVDSTSPEVKKPTFTNRAKNAIGEAMR